MCLCTHGSLVCCFYLLLFEFLFPILFFYFYVYPFFIFPLSLFSSNPILRIIISPSTSSSSLLFYYFHNIRLRPPFFNILPFFLPSFLSSSNPSFLPPILHLFLPTFIHDFLPFPFFISYLNYYLSFSQSPKGLVSSADVTALLQPHTVLVTIMHSNNEVSHLIY